MQMIIILIRIIIIIYQQLKKQMGIKQQQIKMYLKKIFKYIIINIYQAILKIKTIQIYILIYILQIKIHLLQ